jgi:undecaprenyl-diphosphatase
MTLLQAIILGIVQGLTEFIPISSTAHLVFASRWTNIYDGNAQQITATMAVIQLGTLAAVFVYFASDIWGISTAFVRDHVALIRRKGTSPAGDINPTGLSSEARLGWLIIIGSIPIGTIGLVFKDFIEGEGTKNLWIIATMLIVVAILLTIAERIGSQQKDIKHVGLIDAIIVGFAQVLALMPGASRSGSTIMGGLLAGQKRETAARFSFLLSIPAITASGLLELREAIHILPQESFVPLIVGTIVAAIVGYLSIWFLIAFLRTHSTMIFIVYRLVLGTALIVLLWQGILTSQV